MAAAANVCGSSIFPASIGMSETVKRLARVRWTLLLAASLTNPDKVSRGKKEGTSNKRQQPRPHHALYATGPQIQQVASAALVSDQKFSVLDLHSGDKNPLVICLKQRVDPDVVDLRLPKLAAGRQIKS